MVVFLGKYNCLTAKNIKLTCLLKSGYTFLFFLNRIFGQMLRSISIKFFKNQKYNLFCCTGVSQVTIFFDEKSAKIIILNFKERLSVMLKYLKKRVVFGIASLFVSMFLIGCSDNPVATNTNDRTDKQIAASNDDYVNMFTVTKNDKGDLEFHISTTISVRYMECFVKKNGVQIAAIDITSSSHVVWRYLAYSCILPASNFNDGDKIEYRFYSYENGGSSVFTPGPDENIWESGFVY